MPSPLKLDDATAGRLCCPECKSSLTWSDQSPSLRCENGACGATFPILDGVPVLINDDKSIFSIQDFLDRTKTYFAPKTDDKKLSPLGCLRKAFVRTLSPPIDHNIVSARNFTKLGKLLAGEGEHPRVLVIGGSVAGQGWEGLQSAHANFVETDVSLSPHVKVICDAHDIPFATGTFDGVIVQAVLEHVADPYRCVEEIHRVLKPNGLVYAETPFIQQVHAGPYDFTRFTHLGHRRLFRKFEELESGAACAPGMALAWSYKYFLSSFTTRRTPSAIRSLVNVFAHLTSFWLKYFDYFLIDKPGSYDAASGYYFFGRKSDRTLSDKELVQLYRGSL